MKYKFSIITCTKNSAKYLKDNVNSVKSQTFKDYEHVFIDGFSDDGTKEMILEYKKTNPDNIKLFQSEPKGITEAINQGIKHANGEYLIHMHSDDYFDSYDVLEEASVFLHNHGKIDWIYGKAKIISANNRLVRIMNMTRFSRFGSNNSFLKQILKYQNIICHQAVFIRKEVFIRFGLFDEKEPNLSDYDYWLRIMRKTKWRFLDKIVCDFRVHEDSYSSSVKNQDCINISTFLTRKRNLNFIEYYLILPIYMIASYNYYGIKNLIRAYTGTKGKKYLS